MATGIKPGHSPYIPTAWRMTAAVAGGGGFKRNLTFLRGMTAAVVGVQANI